MATTPGEEFLMQSPDAVAAKERNEVRARELKKLCLPRQVIG